ncbi:MAG: DUF3990 domain-containing protein [Candidatus Margulisbacteria bacterium]|jgi:hypothetical protein|nr:DUF3990 domain-containing protein [Candidatus Margulisiibacteriota bacterium]
MKLYHGSIAIVNVPQILTPDPKRTVDFGRGFYTTTDLGQASRWAKIRQNQNQQSGFVSVFEAPDNLLQTPELKILKFGSASREWLDFVMQNRNTPDFKHDYDLVAGPVANDRVYTTLALYESELLDVAETINRLKTCKLVNQVLFHSAKSLRYLTFVEAKDLPFIKAGGG